MEKVSFIYENYFFFYSFKEMLMIVVYIIKNSYDLKYLTTKFNFLRLFLSMIHVVKYILRVVIQKFVAFKEAVLI